MTQLMSLETEPSVDREVSGCKKETVFSYEMSDMKARKIVTLIKISKLPYILDERNNLENPSSLNLKTQYGELQQEYEIIGYIVNESVELSRRDSSNSKESNSQVVDGDEAKKEEEAQIVSLSPSDNYVSVKVSEELFLLRKTLFPMLEEFYKYLGGHEKVKKSKYDILFNKIKKEIARLDSTINEHTQVFAFQNSYLNIIIVCQLFMACKFVFEDKFRSSKKFLFGKCQKIYKKPEFQEVYGKSLFCLKEYLPIQFEEEDQIENKKIEEGISAEIKLSESLSNHQQNENRNELLYNYFKTILTQPQSKLNYFPYFWLMFENLACSIIELSYPMAQHHTSNELQKVAKMVQLQSEKYLKNAIDYGFLGIYLNETTKESQIKGIICLGSKSFEELVKDVESSVELKEFKLIKLDVALDDEKSKIERLFQHSIEHTTYDGISLHSMYYI